ncbi:lasso RiPP family leader peptide-containing protein [Erythrobacter sp. MTPC3]|uniref:lasso RiPP family leader peptide-containing protein n=1 Tax=Erythrobacter sp. MTPC3 TaxID=3056564 RepID=UPI0036F4305C
MVDYQKAAASDRPAIKAYSAPKLIEYGSVRNLTGGSGGRMGDGGGSMTRGMRGMF